MWTCTLRDERVSSRLLAISPAGAATRTSPGPGIPWTSWEDQRTNVLDIADFPSVFPLDIDVCNVASGSALLTVAREFACPESARQVFVLEAGAPKSSHGRTLSTRYRAPVHHGL